MSGVPEYRLRIQIRNDELRARLLTMGPRARSKYIETCLLFYERFNNGVVAEDIARLVSAELKQQGIVIKAETVANPVTNFMKAFN